MIFIYRCKAIIGIKEIGLFSSQLVNYEIIPFAKISKIVKLLWWPFSGHFWVVPLWKVYFWKLSYSNWAAYTELSIRQTFGCPQICLLFSLGNEIYLSLEVSFFSWDFQSGFDPLRECTHFIYSFHRMFCCDNFHRWVRSNCSVRSKLAFTLAKKSPFNLYVDNS